MGIAAGDGGLAAAGPAGVGRVLRSGHGHRRRPDAHPLGPLPAVDSVHGGAVGRRDVPGVSHAAGLEPQRDHRLRVHHEHAADDALLGEQHAVRGARRRDDGRLQRADEPQRLPLRRGEPGPARRDGLHAAAGGQVCRGVWRGRDRAGHRAGKSRWACGPSCASCSS